VTEWHLEDYRRLGNVVGNAQQKNGERQQNGDPERHLLTRVRRYIEDEECKRKTIVTMTITEEP